MRTVGNLRYLIPLGRGFSLRKIVRAANEAVVGMLAAPVLKHEYERGLCAFQSERLVEYAFALRWIAGMYPKTLLDVGTGRSSWPHLLASEGIRVTAVDEMTGYWRGRFRNRHYLVVQDDITRQTSRPSYPCITCLSTLEHIPNHIAAMTAIKAALEPGGLLILTCPYNEREYVANTYELPDAAWGKDAPYVAQQFSRAELEAWLDLGYELIEKELWRAVTGPAWATGKRLTPPVRAHEAQVHQLGCFALLRR
jgi:hypothetical protein